MKKIIIESIGENGADALAHALRIIGAAVQASTLEDGEHLTTSSVCGGAELRVEVPKEPCEKRCGQKGCVAGELCR